VSLADEIFPTDRHPDLVQTEWSKGWGYQSIGFGEAARFLTEHRASFHASLDSVGLAVFYLQRHRVELALKEFLVAHRVELKKITSQHSLLALWRACEQTLASDSDGWGYLEAEGMDLVMLLDEHDRRSDTYRYPVDRDGVEHTRAPYIDLAALEEAVDKLVGAIDGYMAHSEQAREHEREMQREFEQEMRQTYGEDLW
jgi:hypothetical protein